MISSDQWRAYNAAVDSIRSAAEDEVREGVLDWLNEHPGASVAEAREEAARIMRGAVQRHDKAAAALAAEWYDAQGRANGAALDRAVTAPTYSGDAVDTLARYQVRKYMDGDLAGFAAMCGEFAANDAMRSVNDTILRNAKRDRAKGVRFARVTSGRNTCAFCLMLAGRGAVYHTRESAGEFNQWHRHCTCKVVPSFSGDQWETLVEGHDPKAVHDRLREVERLTDTRRGTPEFAREVELRDPEWLYGGAAATDYSLNAAEAYGTLLAPGDYSPENIVNRGNEWRDLWAHHVLEQNGIRAQTHGGQDIDLTINGEWWEVKSPKASAGGVKPGNELDFIEKNLRKASKQFRARGMNGDARVVFNPLYRHAAPDEVMIDEIKGRMKQHRVKEVLFITEDGGLKRIETK